MFRKVGYTLGRFLLWLFVLLGVLLGLNTFTYLNFDPTYGFLKLKQEAIATGWYLPFYYSHIFIGGLVLIAGFIQFNRNIRIKFSLVHRRCGYLYVFGILFLAAPGGMVMSFFINRGPMVLLSFITQCSLWIYFTAGAFRKITQRKVGEHEEWMMRSFALTLAAITLRIYIFVGSFYFDLNQPTAYAVLAWSSWVPNILFTEYTILRKVTSGASVTAAEEIRL
jgi:hypothetical protein